jgi:hypothetical protein
MPSIRKLEDPETRFRMHQLETKNMLVEMRQFTAAACSSCRTIQGPVIRRGARLLLARRGLAPAKVLDSSGRSTLACALPDESRPTIDSMNNIYTMWHSGHP